MNANWGLPHEFQPPGQASAKADLFAGARAPILHVKCRRAYRALLAARPDRGV